MSKPDHYHSPRAIFAFMLFGAVLGGIFTILLMGSFSKNVVGTILILCIFLAAMLLLADMRYEEQLEKDREALRRYVSQNDDKEQ